MTHDCAIQIDPRESWCSGEDLTFPAAQRRGHALFSGIIDAVEDGLCHQPTLRTGSGQDRGGSTDTVGLLNERHKPIGVLRIGKIIYWFSLCPPDVKAFRADRGSADRHPRQIGDDGPHHWSNDNHHVATLQVLLANFPFVANDKHAPCPATIDRSIDRLGLNG